MSLEPSAESAATAATRPIRLLYLIDKLPLGGAQTHLAALACGLDRERFRPSVVCLIREGPVGERLRERGVPVATLGTERIYGARAACAFGRLVARLRAERPDVLHAYLSSANVFGAFAGLLARVPCVLTSRRDTGFGDSPLMRRALAATNRWVTGVVAVSSEVGRITVERERLAPERLTVIANGIDLGRFARRGRREDLRRALGIATAAPVLITVGHLTPVKGVDVLVGAAARIRAAIPGAVVLQVGDGPERQTIRLQAERLGLGDAFRLLGDRRDVPDLLEASDLFVLPSRSEGQPNAMMEAMAMGLPVVATRVGGVPELVSSGRDGLLVEPSDPEALALACVELLRSPERARRLGAAAAERARREFGLERMIERYQRLYLDAVAGR